MVHTGNEIVDVIINEKGEEAKKYATSIEVDGDMKGISIAPMDLCTIFSNLLDNAIEATSLVEETKRIIKICVRKTGDFCFLSIENYTASKVEISEQMHTTKSKKSDHGFGIGNVERTVKKYGGEFRLDCQERNNYYVFTAEVMMPFLKD